MPSLLPGYEYDIFISYRQNDNRSGWVRQFVEDLREELGATLKDPVNIYFDENPHDGLQDTHLVDESLKGKLKCLIFIPILSRTYCDPKSFAWNHEFVPFCRIAGEDSLGIQVRLTNGNVTSRILALQIHDLDSKDKQTFENHIGSPLRSIEFVFRSSGVNRPLTAADARSENLGKTIYRDQINKTANAIEQILSSLVVVEPQRPAKSKPHTEPLRRPNLITWFYQELRRRNVIRAGVVYVVVSLLLLQALALITPLLKIEERVIQLITGMLAIGFPFAILLAWQYEISPHGFIRTTSEQALSNPYPPNKKKPLTSAPMLFVLIASLALLAVYVKLFIDPPGLAAGRPITIAVLPFENRGGNPSDKYIADGITDDIINRLTSTGKLLVRARSSIQQFTGSTVIYGEVANLLQVGYIVKGSVLRDGQDILVTAQLIDGRESYLWGDTFKRSSGDIIQLQSEISAKIVAQLKIKLNEIELDRLLEQPTENATAYDHYLRGRSYYFKYESEANDSAVTEFHQAIQLDPSYALAWAGLGDALAQKHGRFAMEYHWTDSGLLASQRSIELDSTLAEGYKAQAVAYSYQKKYDKAVALLNKAVALSPTYVQAIGNLGTNYFSLRDLPNALKWELTSAALDPTNWIPYQIIGRTYRLLGDLREAESWLTKSLDKPRGRRYDTYEHLGYTYVAQGRKQQALKLIDDLLKLDEKDTRVLEAAGLIAHFAGDLKAAETYFQRSIELNPNYKDDRNTYSPIGLGQIMLSKGNRIEAEVYLSHALFNLNADLEQGSQSADLPFYVASIHAIRGNRDKALEWLQKAINQKWIDHAMIEFGPYFAAYRQDKGFNEVLLQLKRETTNMLKETRNE